MSGNKTDKFEIFHTWAMTVSTIVMAIATVFMWQLGKRQTDIAERQTDLARTQTRLTEAAEKRYVAQEATLLLQSRKELSSVVSEIVDVLNNGGKGVESPSNFEHCRGKSKTVFGLFDSCMSNYVLLQHNKEATAWEEIRNSFGRLATKDGEYVGKGTNEIACIAEYVTAANSGTIKLLQIHKALGLYPLIEAATK